MDISGNFNMTNHIDTLVNVVRIKPFAIGMAAEEPKSTSMCTHCGDFPLPMLDGSISTHICTSMHLRLTPSYCMRPSVKPARVYCLNGFKQDCLMSRMGQSLSSIIRAQRSSCCHCKSVIGFIILPFWVQGGFHSFVKFILDLHRDINLLPYYWRCWRWWCIFGFRWGFAFAHNISN